MQVRRSRLAVYAWVEREGFVLLSKVADGYAWAGHWTLPGGGVDWGEHPEDSMHRELYEETGLKGTIEEQLGIDSITFEPNDHNGYTSVHAVRIIYRMSATGDPRVTEVDGSTADAAWLPLANVLDLPTVDLVGRGRILANGA